MRRALLAAPLVPMLACIPPGSYPWAGGTASGGTAGAPAADGTAAPADTAPPSPDLAPTGAARNLVQLTTSPGAESRPLASPDGKTILFTAWSYQVVDGQTTDDLAEESVDAIRPDGRGLAVYSSRRAFGYNGAWLGAHGFAYISNAMGEWQVVRAARVAANAATTVVVRASDAPEVAGLSATRDGRLLAFHAKLRDELQIETVRPDGGELTTVAPGQNPRFSPDGTRLAFERQVDNTWRVFVTGVDGGDETQVTDGEMDCETPSWSPDGAWLVMACNGGWNRFPDATAAVRNLYAIHPDGSGLTQLTDGARSSTFPDWSVDGNIYFQSDQAGNLDLWRVTPELGGATAPPAAAAR